MRSGEIGPKELLQHLQVPGEPGALAEPIYVLGSFERRVTLYSQQVRALNLAYALFDQGRLREGSTVAVIGGGVAGVTAAAALAHLGAAVHLIERRDVLLPLQRGCRTRWIHPRIYDWPELGSDDHEAGLPLVNWRAGYAHDVARTLDEALQRVVRRTGDRIQVTVSGFVKSLVVEGGKVRVSWDGRAPTGRKVHVRPLFDTAVVAVGFGTEKGTAELPMSSYWRNDDIDQPVLTPGPDRVRCLVSGNGDGGLIDVLRLRLRHFQLESLHDNLRNALSRSAMDKLAAQVSEWESRAHEESDTWLWDRYNLDLELPAEFTDRFQHELLRADTEVWLAAAQSPISFRSAVLNRLWVALLVKHDLHTHWVESRTRQLIRGDAGTKMCFADLNMASRECDIAFDRVIVRHGPTGALAGPLQWIHDRCRIVLDARNALDQTRWPMWKPDTFGPVEPPAGSASQPPPATPAAASRQPAAAGGEGVLAGRADAAGTIEFVEHCRVDLGSVRSVTRRSGERAPALRWHAAIRNALELIRDHSRRLDELLAAGANRGHSHDVLGFKQAFFDGLDRLSRVEYSTVQQLHRLWSFLADAGPGPSVAALRTFASLAALRLIARIRTFEGRLFTDDGHTIVNLFPDLPPIPASWLLRQVPYRSPVGGLALGEDSFLLSRVGPSETNYNSFLLPKWLAESAQEERKGLSRNAWFAWIVPQWFFQDHAGDPEPGPVVWVLTDEYGRERRSASASTPWRDDVEREAEPHPAFASGGELRERAPGWYVMTRPSGPLRDRASDAEAFVLQDCSVLWVDDQPDNNMFEVSYLERLGASVSRAVSTELALRRVASGGIDLIISDLTRTEDGERRALAGIELMDKVHDLLRDRETVIPIVFYVGHRGDVPPAIRSIAAEDPRTLFALIERQLRTGPSQYRGRPRPAPAAVGHERGRLLREPMGLRFARREGSGSRPKRGAMDGGDALRLPRPSRHGGLRLASAGPRPRRRLLSMVYDSPYQARCFDKYGTAAIGAFRARMRLDALLWNRLVLTDAQLLDGQFFHSIVASTSGLRSATALFQRTSEIGPLVEVRSRAARVEDALLGMVVRRGSDTLKAMIFSSVTDEGQRKRAAEQLVTIPASRVSSWPDIPRLLRAIGVDPEITERMDAAWASWVEAQNTGWLRFESWQPTFVHHLPVALGVEGLDDPWSRDLLPDARAKAIDLFERRASLVDRSAVYKELDVAVRRAGATRLDSIEQAVDLVDRPRIVDDFLRIQAWYDRGYNRATAWQHGAELQWISDGRVPHTRVEQDMFDLAASEPDAPSLREADRAGAVIVVPVSFMELLRDLPDKDFYRLVSSNRTALDHLLAWQREGQVADLRIALDPLIKEATSYRTSDSVAEFSEATQIAVRRALGAVAGGAPGGEFELDHVIIDESVGVTTHKVVESFGRDDDKI